MPRTWIAVRLRKKLCKYFVLVHNSGVAARKLSILLMFGSVVRYAYKRQLTTGRQNCIIHQKFHADSKHSIAGEVL